MYERFTDRARRVVVLAQEEARTFRHNYIGTEHLLLGLAHEGEGVAAQALEALGVSLEAVRSQVQEIIGQGQQAPAGHIPFTSRGKRVLELSLREALQLGHNYIGTEHILLGLLREGEGIGAQVLVKLGAELTRVREQVVQILSNYQTQAQTPTKAEKPTLDQIIREIVRDEINNTVNSMAKNIPASSVKDLEDFLGSGSMAGLSESWTALIQELFREIEEVDAVRKVKVTFTPTVAAVEVVEDEPRRY